MKPKFDNTKNKKLPKGCIPCDYVDEKEKGEALKNNRPFHPYYTTTEYFKILRQRDSHTLEGYLGRTDHTALFFDNFDPTITYFIDYEKRKDGFFSFDKTQLFKVSFILPETPLLFILKKINLITMAEESDNKLIHQTTIHAGQGNIITTGNNNMINARYTFLKGNLNKFHDELAKYHVSSEDIKEISEIVQREQPQNGKLPGKANSWVSKMLQKSLDGTWEVGVAAAGGMLVELLKGYFGLT